MGDYVISRFCIWYWNLPAWAIILFGGVFGLFAGLGNIATGSVGILGYMAFLTFSMKISLEDYWRKKESPSAHERLEWLRAFRAKRIIQ